MKLQLLKLILLTSLLIFLPAGIVKAQHPATAIIELYKTEYREQDTAEPYIVSILALNEVEQGRHYPEVKSFINWYFSHLNYPDRHGLTGTIYVYNIKNGQETCTYAYDSVDGYAGMFLYLLERYVSKTGDVEVLHANWAKIEDIAYLIARLQDKDGLTFALPDSPIKYLMDNCEAYGGINSYLLLRSRLDKGPSPYYASVQNSIKDGIYVKLYDSRTGRFFWAVEESHRSQSSFNRHYPDLYAQILPVHFGLLSDMPEGRSVLWRQINDALGSSQANLPVEQRIMYQLTKQKMEAQHGK